MRLSARLLGISTILAACLAVQAAEDWPQWRGPRGDGISKETLPDSLPDPPKKDWSLKAGEGFASPIAVKNVLYIFTSDGSKETLLALDAAGGKTLWIKSYDMAGKSPSGFSGTRATPTYENGMIYTLGEAGQLTCWDSSTEGKILWQTDILKETGAKNLKWGTASNPLLIGDRIYVQVGDGGPLAIGVNKSTGKIEWQTDGKGQCSYAHIIEIETEGSRQLVICGGKSIYGAALDSGKILWEQPMPASYDINATTPLFRDGRLFLSNGYSTGGSLMLKVTATGATREWTSKDMKSRFQGLILDGDYVFGNSEGKLTCIKWADGKAVWSEKLDDLKEGGSVIKSGDKLLVFGQHGTLYLFKVDGDKHEKIGETQIFDGDQFWATPLLYNGKLYVRAKDDLACLDLTTK